jgi:hypothetical protein
VLVEYLREFKEEKDKSICKVSKADLKVFSIISNGKCVNGAPYTDPSQFLSALCAFSRDLGVIFYPAKCKGIFSFDFGQSVFIEEFSYSGYLEITAQCKQVDMTDFSPKAKRPALLKLTTIAELLACIDNLLNLANKIFKPEVTDEVTRLKAFLYRNQNEIKDRQSQSPRMVERLTDWTNDMLRRLRMGFDAGTTDMMNEYRTRIHITAAEYANVIQSAMWDSITHLRSNKVSTGGAGGGNGAKTKGNGHSQAEKNAQFQIIRKALPPRGDKKICFRNLTAKGCPGGADKCTKPGFCHFIPKKSEVPSNVLLALEQVFGTLRADLN